MLTNAQEKLIKQLHKKKYRREHGLCIVEGEKVITLAKKYVSFKFGAIDTKNFNKLVTTQTPQDEAAIAKIPEWSAADITHKKTIVVLDGVQDPGNVGSVLRLCLGFNASLILINSADISSSKVIRSSVGAMFQVPWLQMSPEDALAFVQGTGRSVYRLEKRDTALAVHDIKFAEEIVLIAGSEGTGIHTNFDGVSTFIAHNNALESLNVAHAVALSLYTRYIYEKK